MEKELHIIYTCDNAYLMQVGISMQSVIVNNPDSHIIFYLATETDINDNYNKIVNFYKDNKKIEIKYLDCMRYDNLLEEKKVDKWGSSSYYVYRRLFAYDLLDVDYVWYLDADILCLSEIDNPVLEEKKVIGTVIDCAHADYNKIAHINKDYYFYNDGTMFVDVKKWKNSKCTEKVINYIENMKYRPLMCDQDILSISLQDEIQPISPKYDYFAGYDYYGVHNSFKMYSLDKKPFYSEKEVEKASKEVVFYHCLEGVFGRPWQEDNYSPVKDEYQKYQKQSAWPDYQTKKNDSLLFKIERKLEKLPSPIYTRIHNLAQKIYLRYISKKYQ